MKKKELKTKKQNKKELSLVKDKLKKVRKENTTLKKKIKKIKKSK